MRSSFLRTRGSSRRGLTDRLRRLPPYIAAGATVVELQRVGRRPRYLATMPEPSLHRGAVERLHYWHQAEWDSPPSNRTRSYPYYPHSGLEDRLTGVEHRSDDPSKDTVPTIDALMSFYRLSKE